MAGTVERFIKLNDGNSIPVIGLGTFQGNYDYTSVHDIVVKSVKTAIDLGYRHFDTSFIYDTEAAIGEAVRDKIHEGVVQRDALFIVTKLWSNSHGKENVVPALRESLKKLNLDYVDMFLIHWPVAFKSGNELFPKDDKGQIILNDEVDFTDTWQGMIECKRLGLARSIGISNFNQKQIKRLVDSTDVCPSLIQIEVNPFLSNAKIVRLCQQLGITVACYSPLGKPGRPWKTDSDPFISTDVTLNEIAKAHTKTPIQAALRYLLQKGLVVIPKSSSYDHIKENIDIFGFQLTDEEMKSIDENCCSRNFRVVYLREMFGHSKEYPFSED